MKKNIIFFLTGMYLGGTEKVLLEMINEMTKNEKLNITIGLVDIDGELTKDIPSSVNILEIPMSDNDRYLFKFGARKSTMQAVNNLRFFTALKIISRKILNKDNYNGVNITKLPTIGIKYDIAVSYYFHYEFITRYVAENVSANKKFVWFHNDILNSSLNLKKYNKFIEKYDQLFTVSHQIEREVKSTWPTLKRKVSTFYNFIDLEKINLKSQEIINDSRFKTDKITITSVGRLVNQKGFDLGLQAMHMLKKNGYDFYWYIIGDGPDKLKLNKLIKDFNLERNVFLLGAKRNPYKYMDKSEVYFQPSRHEGYSTTTNEARVLGLPIITTDVSGANEQFENNVNGIICEINPNSMFESLKYLIDSENTRKKFTDCLHDFDFNANSKEKLKQFFFDN